MGAPKHFQPSGEVTSVVLKQLFEEELREGHTVMGQGSELLLQSRTSG